MKKYAIVRVDKFCPRALERNYNLKCIGSLHCDKCDLRKKYGDTKEQLIAKVEQILWQEMKKEFVSKHTISSKPIARKIVEFLGVEE